MNEKKLLILIKQYKYSCGFIGNKEEKNNFIRMREIFDNNKKYGIIFHSYIIPILINCNNLSNYSIGELKLILSVVKRTLNQNKIPMISSYKHCGFLLSNIQQENRLRRNFIRFLKILNKDLDRELSKKIKKA